MFFNSPCCLFLSQHLAFVIISLISCCLLLSLKRLSSELFHGILSVQNSVWIGGVWSVFLNACSQSWTICWTSFFEILHIVIQCVCRFVIVLWGEVYCNNSKQWLRPLRYARHCSNSFTGSECYLCLTDEETYLNPNPGSKHSLHTNAYVLKGTEMIAFSHFSGSISRI